MNYTGSKTSDRNLYTYKDKIPLREKQIKELIGKGFKRKELSNMNEKELKELHNIYLG